ncbi:MAG: PIN domain-containing protein [Firmicutes bacterium]|nr:PIN domain-containing protein [Bacillota bacterium]
MEVKSLLDEVRRHQAILIGTNVVIYFLEGSDVYGEAAEGLFRLIQSGEAQGHLSVITAAELLVKPIETGNTELQEAINTFLNYFPNLKLLDVTKEIAIKAAEIRGTTGLKVPDALLMATAVIHRCAVVGNDLTCAKKATDAPYIYLAGF